MFRTVWLENPVVPDIGLAAQDATHLVADEDEDEDEDEDDAGTSATTPRASDACEDGGEPPAPVLTDDSDFNT
jgi:hypothetical protein